MKKKLPRVILVCSILAAVALPASVYAAVEPIDLGVTTSTQTLPITPIVPTTVPNSTPTSTGREEIQNKTDSPLGLDERDSTIYCVVQGCPFYSGIVVGQQQSLQVPTIVSVSRQIFRSINTGDISGAIKQVLGILGQLGLVDPATDADQVATDASNTGGSSTGNPYANPQTPEQVYNLQRHIDVVRSEDAQKLSQVMFGPLGQEAASQQLQNIQSAEQVSLYAQQGVADTYQDSVAQAEQNLTSSNSVEAKSKAAQSKNVSQGVLKAIASQNEDLAKIAAGNSAQLAYLGKAADYQSAQISATNAQLTALNDKTQNLEVLAASQNYQSALLNTAIDRQSHYQEVKDSAQENAAYQSSSLIYIPGLVPKGDTAGD